MALHDIHDMKMAGDEPAKCIFFFIYKVVGEAGLEPAKA